MGNLNVAVIARSGALLGISEWYLEAKKFTLAGDYAGLGLELPLTQKHKAAWSIALAVAMLLKSGFLNRMRKVLQMSRRRS